MRLMHNESYEKSRSHSVNHDQQRSSKCSRTFSEYILRVRNSEPEDKPLPQQGCAGEEQNCSLRSACESHADSRTKANLSRLVFLFCVFLSYSSLGSGQRCRPTYTLEQRSGDDCCHYCNPRPRGPLKYATHTVSHMRDGEQACERTIVNRFLDGSINREVVGQSTNINRYKRKKLFFLINNLINN